MSTIFSIGVRVCPCKLVSLWRENEIAVVILLPVFARAVLWRKQVLETKAMSSFRNHKMAQLSSFKQLRQVRRSQTKMKHPGICLFLVLR